MIEEKPELLKTTNISFNSSGFFITCLLKAALIERLVSLDKRFTMMGYPNANHGLGRSRATQYHLYDLHTWYLSQNMPGGAR